jgi:predicted short-subunit dehydrogenase-like oxidoreductase (DUF2520 family)
MKLKVRVEHMKFNIIGAGRLGKNIAQALSTLQLIKLDSICNQNLDSAIQASHAIGRGKAVNHIKELPAVDVTWITSNDDAIAPIVKHLNQSHLIKPRSFVIHCSGVLNSALLAPLKDKGCLVASFHPLKAFTDNIETNAFKGVDCVLEGDEEVCSWLQSTFTQLGANIITIQPEAKALYHTAAILASNYLITLASCSEELMLKAGIPPHSIRAMICNLMQGNLNNLQRVEHIAQALTGPLMRGDVETLSLHLKTIDNPEIDALYKTAGLATLPLTSLSEETKQRLKKILAL